EAHRELAGGVSAANIRRSDHCSRRQRSSSNKLSARKLLARHGHFLFAGPDYYWFFCIPVLLHPLSGRAAAEILQRDQSRIVCICRENTCAAIIELTLCPNRQTACPHARHLAKSSIIRPRHVATHTGDGVL